jgi:type I restriction enzyme S subunit
MRQGWATANLGEVCEMINRGISPKYIDDGGVCVINQKCIRNHTINTSLARRHDLAAKLVNPERYIKVGDVLVNSTGTGTLGRVAQVRRETKEPTTVDTHVTIVRPHAGKFFNDFFGYMLVRIEDEIASSGEGASGQTELARLTIAESSGFPFPYPSLNKSGLWQFWMRRLRELIERSPTPKRTSPTPANYLKAI